MSGASVTVIRLGASSGIVFATMRLNDPARRLPQMTSMFWPCAMSVRVSCSVAREGRPRRSRAARYRSPCRMLELVDSGVLAHPGPALHLGGDMLPEFLRRGGLHNEAHIKRPFAQRVRGQHFGDGLIGLVDDLFRGACGEGQ